MTQAHSLLGASSAYRWLQCPGSFKLSQTAPHRPSSIYAATGTLAHEYIETAVAAGITEIDPAQIGKTWTQDGHTVTVDQAFIDGINVMLAFLSVPIEASRWSEVEFRVSLADYFTQGPPPPAQMFGTVDAAILHSPIDLEVVDYKNGSGVVVSPVENPQLLYYAAGVLRHLPPDQRAWVQHITLTIVQPHAPGAPVRSWVISAVDLLMWVDEVLVPGVEACTRPDAPLNPGSWCRFCPVSHACPRLMQDAVAMAQREFDDADVVMPTEPDDLAFSLDIAERAQLWVDRVREHAIEQLKSQVRIPGWGLVPTRPTRKWVVPDADIGTRLARLGISHDQVWETRLRSPAQVEKMVGRQVWGEVDKLVESRSSGVKLARTGTSAKEDFTDEE